MRRLYGFSARIASMFRMWLRLALRWQGIPLDSTTRISSGRRGWSRGSVQLNRPTPPTSHSAFALAMMAPSSAGSMKPVGSLTSRELPTGQDGQRRLHDPRTSMLKKNRVTSPLYEACSVLPTKFRETLARLGELSGQCLDFLRGLVGGGLALAGALLLHRLRNGLRIAQLGATQAGHGGDEGVQALAIHSCELIGRPQGGGRPAQLSERRGGLRLAGLRQRGRPGVPRSREIRRGHGVDLFESAIRDRGHELSVPRVPACRERPAQKRGSAPVRPRMKWSR